MSWILFYIYNVMLFDMISNAETQHISLKQSWRLPSQCILESNVVSKLNLLAECFKFLCASWQSCWKLGTSYLMLLMIFRVRSRGAWICSLYLGRQRVELAVRPLHAHLVAGLTGHWSVCRYKGWKTRRYRHNTHEH